MKVAADPSGALKFEQSSLTAPAGKDTFEFTNKSSTPHDFVIEDSGGKEIAKTDGDHRRHRHDRRDPEGRRVHVLLLGTGSPPGRHGRYAHGQVVVSIQICVTIGTLSGAGPG